MSELTRDFVGYADNPPDPQWPGGARLAVNFVINYEEGSEASVPWGDGYSESGLIESPASPVPHGQRDLGAESMFEYGSRVGFWRLMRLFAERSLPLTVFGCALALEQNPAAARAIVEAGHDVCCHGWRWVEHYKLGEAEEREHIHRAVASLEASVGSRPLGWYCRYGPSLKTRRLLVEEGGFIYDSDTYNDELPYWTKIDDTPHLLIPYTLTNNDTKFARGFIGNGEDFYRYLRDGFDLLRAEGTRQPKMMSVGLHMRISGHPSRASGLQRFLDHVVNCGDVWVCRRADIARHWLATHPYSGG
jgi:allantoinase